MSDQIVEQMRADRNSLSHLLYAVISLVANIENHISFAYRCPNFFGFVASGLPALQVNFLSS